MQVLPKVRRQIGEDYGRDVRETLRTVPASLPILLVLLALLAAVAFAAWRADLATLYTHAPPAHFWPASLRELFALHGRLCAPRCGSNRGPSLPLAPSAERA